MELNEQFHEGKYDQEEIKDERQKEMQEGRDFGEKKKTKREVEL